MIAVRLQSSSMMVDHLLPSFSRPSLASATPRSLLGRHPRSWNRQAACIPAYSILNSSPCISPKQAEQLLLPSTVPRKERKKKRDMVRTKGTRDSYFCSSPFLLTPPHPPKGSQPAEKRGRLLCLVTFLVAVRYLWVYGYYLLRRAWAS
jgi:hypothetical protein